LDGLVGDLPTGDGLGETGGAGGLALDGLSHFGEGGEDLGRARPDGDFLHIVMVGDGGLFEAVGDGQRGEAVDAGDVAVAVAESGGEAGSGGGDGVAAGVDAHLLTLFEEERFDERVHPFGRGLIGGFEGEAGVGEEAVGMAGEVSVESEGEVRRCGGVLGSGASRGGDKESKGDSACDREGEADSSSESAEAFH